jgi:hypothetical protein
MPVSKSKRSRYTPPPPRKAPPSALWVPVTMGTLMLCGIAVVLLNYMGMLPGDGRNSYTLFGIALIAGGFGLATTYR